MYKEKHKLYPFKFNFKGAQYWKLLQGIDLKCLTSSWNFLIWNVLNIFLQIKGSNFKKVTLVLEGAGYLRHNIIALGNKSSWQYYIRLSYIDPPSDASTPYTIFYYRTMRCYFFRFLDRKGYIWFYVLFIGVFLNLNTES